jgi:hypothetical protein
MFGNLFNEIQVDRYGSDGVTPIQSINVPIEYGPKQKFIRRVTADPAITREQFSTQLPRLGFEMTGISYAPGRKLNSAHRFTKGVNTGGTDFDFVYTPVPYDMNFSLFVLVKNAEDGAQIIEQIIPFFVPDWTVTMKVLPSMDIRMDVPIELASVTLDDQYEGDFDTRRVLTWQMDFTVKGYLFGPLQKYKYINNANVSSSTIEGFTVSFQDFAGNSAFQVTETITEVQIATTPISISSTSDSTLITSDSTSITTDTQ